jgi:hypothetical protein
MLWFQHSLARGVCLISFVTVATAVGATVTYSFSGTFTSSSRDEIPRGTAFSGTFSYEAGLVASPPFFFATGTINPFYLGQKYSGLPGSTHETYDNTSPTMDVFFIYSDFAPSGKPRSTLTIYLPLGTLGTPGSFDPRALPDSLGTVLSAKFKVTTLNGLCCEIAAEGPATITAVPEPSTSWFLPAVILVAGGARARQNSKTRRKSGGALEVDPGLALR